MSPRKAKNGTWEQLPQDNYDTRSSWILLTNSTVILCNQLAGKKATESITMKRRDFNALVDWYMRDQPRNTTGE